MFRRIEHIGIAVKDLEAANAMFESLSGIGLLKIEEIEREGVRTSFFQIGDSKVEFLQSLRPDTAIAKFIEKNGEGMHHIAFLVDDIEASIAELRAKGFELIHDSPVAGADNKRIAFLHPRSTGKVLVELCEEVG